MAIPKQTRPPAAEAVDPAFVIKNAADIEHLGLTKSEWFSAFVLAGIFAGPAGRAILNKPLDAGALERARDIAKHMGDLMASGG